MKKITSYKITSSLKDMEDKLIEQTGVKRTWIHENAIKSFYRAPDHNVEPALLNRSYHVSPDYVVRDAREQVYLSAELENMIKELAEYNHCSYSVVFCHALMVYVINECCIRGIEI